jgi:2-polyprenyl-3-methyl-5-hydroxy-6-metoxy-1,4-benzoquinol methylase
MKQPAHVREQVISANVEFYKEIAKKYDNYEACASEEYFQQILEFDVEKMESLLTNHDIHCLDCGGGSGNLTLKMLKRGWAVTVVDVSSDMLEISKGKVASYGYKADFVNDSIEHFLANSGRVFDVITFSSVLHHLYTPLNVVNDIAARVKVGGFFYSNFDPVLPSSRLLTTCFYNLDTILAKMHNDRRDILPGIGRRLRKFFIARDSAHSRSIASPGDLAEYHARLGLDDVSIEKSLEQNGFIVERERYPSARTKLMQAMNRYLHATLNFKILAQRKVVDAGMMSLS